MRVISRLVSWLKTSRVGLAARRTSMSSRFSANSRSSASGDACADDRVLDVVDGIAESVGEREVAVDDVVADRPQQVVRAMGEDGGHAGAQVMRRARVPARVVDGEQEPEAEHDVDLVR